MASTTPRGSFSNANRHMQEEETLQLTSVGVDIGSSTSHLVFSRLELTLEGSRYRVTKREVLNESQILLTPYVDDTRIDVEALETFSTNSTRPLKSVARMSTPARSFSPASPCAGATLAPSPTSSLRRRANSWP